MLDSRHACTAQHLQLGEGLLLADVDMDGLLSADDPAQAIADVLTQEVHLLGATREGCVFHAAPVLIHTEARGQRIPTAETLLIGPWQATLSGTLLEMTAANASRLLNVPLPAGKMLAIPCAGAVSAAMNRLCWLGNTGEGLMAIELLSPVSTGGLRFRAGYRGAGESAFSFMAQQQRMTDADLPFRIHWLKGVTA